MTEPTPEPTLADVMEYLKQFSGHVMAEFSKVNDRFEQVDEKIGALDTKVGALDAKVDAVDMKVDAVETSLRHEIRDAENRLGRKIDDVQNVVRTLKADLAGHMDDPSAHGHAA